MKTMDPSSAFVAFAAAAHAAAITAGTGDRQVRLRKKTTRKMVLQMVTCIVGLMLCQYGALGFSQHAHLAFNGARNKLSSTTALFEASGDGEMVCTRRDAIGGAVVAATTSILAHSLPANAASKPADVQISATWTAVDGLNSLDQKFVSFDGAAYKAMKEDPTRTPLFQKAIERRLGNDPQSMSVLDLGTGPFALFALIAAQAGAGKVYAIEANPEAAQSARAYVKQAGYQDVVTIIEGFSTKVELPEKVDFCVAEIVGSVCSEEGAYASVRDAHARLVKDPTQDSSWIPSRIQTYAAPASYTLHNLFGPPDFDWSKLKGEPVRFNCRDLGLELLSDPVLVEDISFADILTKEQDVRNKKKDIVFTVDEQRIKDNTLTLYDEFRRGKSSVQDSEILAQNTAHSLSGIALWPRLILDDTTIVDSRHFGDGSHQKSHWQTVLPIMSGRPVQDLVGGEQVKISFDFTLPVDVVRPPIYSIQGAVHY